MFLVSGCFVKIDGKYFATGEYCGKLVIDGSDFLMISMGCSYRYCETVLIGIQNTDCRLNEYNCLVWPVTSLDPYFV